ncbi:MAG: hypothetical protein HKN16_03580, partial [Saprospiraceae bacterium]|nr:hypothetical protein [Saprospiraceae bacterium]
MNKEILLVGNPNVGKTSLFNLLTGLNQKTGNYEGVTVEKKVGRFNGQLIIDLPGIKSLWASNLDEIIAAREILNARNSETPVLFIASGTKLEENLLLFSQIADLQIPMVLVVNYKDELEKNNIQIDIAKLRSKIGCPVALVNSRSGDGFAELRELIRKEEFNVPNAFARSQFDKQVGDEIQNQYGAELSNFLGQENSESAPGAIEDLERRHLIIHTILEGTIQMPEQFAQD